MKLQANKAIDLVDLRNNGRQHKPSEALGEQLTLHYEHTGCSKAYTAR